MLECKRRGMYDVGFTDLYIVNKIVLQHHPKDVEHDLYTFLTEQSLRRIFYFLTTSSECSYLVHIVFCLLGVKFNR
jgi:hypothetical protein